MLNLELSDWLYLGGSAAFIVIVLCILKIAYSAKRHIAFTPTKPFFCLLPKYEIGLPVPDTNLEEEL